MSNYTPLEISILDGIVEKLNLIRKIRDNSSFWIENVSAKNCCIPYWECLKSVDVDVIEDSSDILDNLRDRNKVRAALASLVKKNAISIDFGGGLVYLLDNDYLDKLYILHDFGNGPELARKHPNGGGMVARTVTLDDCVYVGENAQVSGYVHLEGLIEIRGDAKVFAPVIMPQA